MKRWRTFIPGGLVFLVFLGGCMATVTPPSNPYPYSFSDPDKQPYPRTWTGAQRFISDARDLGEYDSYPHWNYVKNDYVQSPILSEQTRTGDCDDYAVMMAAYLQDYFGYDTFVALLCFLNKPPKECGHAVCFVEEGSGLVTQPPGCSYWPRIKLIDNGKNYVPVDFSACPEWTWVEKGGTVDYWSGRTFNLATNEEIYLEYGVVHEWNELVNLELSLPLDNEGRQGLEPIPAVRITSPSLQPPTTK